MFTKQKPKTHCFYNTNLKKKEKQVNSIFLLMEVPETKEIFD